MTISRNISVLAQGASATGILAGGYGGLGASVAPTTAGNVLFTADGSVWSSTQKIVQAATSPASGTSVSFTGIPSWVKRITLTIQGISTTGTSAIQVQLGTGATPTYATSGYLSCSTSVFNTNQTTAVNNTGGFSITPGGQATTAVYHGEMTLVNSSGNNWVEFGATGRSDSTVNAVLAGSIALGATLTALRITTILGTPTFNAGTFNILYE